MAKSGKNLQQSNEQSKTFNLGGIESNSLPNNDLSLDEYLNKFEIFIKSHIRIYYSLNQVREINKIKILVDKVITEQCEYLTNLYKEVKKLPILSTKQNLLDSIKNECLVQNDKFILEKTYNILHSKVYNLKSDFSPVTQNSLRIINLSNNSRVEIEHVKYYNFIIGYIDDTLNEIDKIFTTKRFNESNQTETKLTIIETPAKAIDFTKIKWKLKTPTLAYLFFKLEKNGLIQIENTGATLSKIFVDNKQSDIDNITLNKYLNQFSLPKSPNTSNKTEIDEIIKLIKDLDQKL